MTRLAWLVPVVIACGGGPKPATIENKATGPLLPIQSGYYPCEFVIGDYITGPFKCTIRGDRLEKEQGIEFAGTLTPHGDTVRLDAEITCKADSYYQEMCKTHFTVELARMSNGVFRGKVTNAGKLADWGIADQVFQITNASMGGDQYGGAGYGGARYGGGAM